jgi:hypothetical protein
MSRLTQLLGAILAMLSWLPAAAQAGLVQAEGIAALAPGRAAARTAAINDALHQAGLTTEAQVQATDTMGQPGVPGATLLVRPATVPEHYTVLREWQADGLYHVLLQASVNPPPRRTVATVLKKTVAVTRFYMAVPQQGADIADFDTGVAREMARRLQSTGRYTVHLTDTLPFPLQHTEFTHDPDGSVSADRVKAIAGQAGSQFVVTGRILDAGATPGLTPYLGHTSTLNAGQGALFPLPFADLAVGLARQPRHRRLEIELLVYDGLSGALIGQQRFTTETGGSVTVGRDKPVGSVAFFRTRFGTATDALLGAMVQASEKDLDCLPFMARVVRIDHGRAIIDSGTTAGIRPGDKMTAFRQDSGAAVMGLNNEVLGWAERPAATLVIQQVQPRFAIGELSPGNTDLQPGDIVRAGS